MTVRCWLRGSTATTSPRNNLFTEHVGIRKVSLLQWQEQFRTTPLRATFYHLLRALDTNLATTQRLCSDSSATGALQYPKIGEAGMAWSGLVRLGVAWKEDLRGTGVG